MLVKRSGPLYAFPFMFIAKGPGTALGIARHAIDALTESADGLAVLAASMPRCERAD